MKFVFNFSWNIGRRLKPILRDSFHSVETEYGILDMFENPSYDFALEILQYLRVKLNDGYLDRLFSGVEASTFNIKDANIIFGYLGFLTITVSGDYKNVPDGNLFGYFDRVESEMSHLADVLSKETDFVHSFLHSYEEYLTDEMDICFSRPTPVIEMIKKYNTEFLSEYQDGYLYSYNTFIQDDEIALLARRSIDISADDAGLMYGDSHSWQKYDHHLWLVKDIEDEEKSLNLSFTSIQADWEVLILDVGVMNYKSMMLLVVNKHPLSPDVMRRYVNADNLSIQELGLCMRDMSMSGNNLILRCRSEYGYEERKRSFESAQRALMYATDSIDTSSQSRSSKMTGFVLTVLTAMSVYSVFCDAYSLLNMGSDVTFSPVTSLLFSISTLLMVVIIAVQLRQSVS